MRVRVAVAAVGLCVFASLVAAAEEKKPPEAVEGGQGGLQETGLRGLVPEGR